MTVPVTVLVVAKAPVPGLAKTRLARTLGAEAAADLAAAALLDTLDAVAAGQSHISIMLDYTPPPPAPAQPLDIASVPVAPGGL